MSAGWPLISAHPADDTGPVEVVVVGAVAVAAFVWLRIVAARRVAAGDGRFVWVVFAPSLVAGMGLVAAAAADFGASPIVGVAFAIGAVIFLFSAVRFTMRAASGVDRARSADEIAAAVTDPFIEHTVLLISLILVGGLLSVAALIVWGISRAAG